MKTGKGLNTIPVFTEAQAVDVNVDDYVWLIDGSVPTVTEHVPKPYGLTETVTYKKLLPFKLKVSAGCYLTVILDGEDPAGSGTRMYFNEGENNQMVIKVLNDVNNSLTGADEDGDIVAYR